MDIILQYLEEIGQVLFAFIIGAIIGLEREFRSKPAGFRTMILICVGSCLYTILSKEVGDGSDDRIASNIVTGIGFIGAGVIFKEGISVNGLTTAALIWITAAFCLNLDYGSIRDGHWLPQLSTHYCGIGHGGNCIVYIRAGSAIYRGPA